MDIILFVMAIIVVIFITIGIIIYRKNRYANNMMYNQRNDEKILPSSTSDFQRESASGDGVHQHGKSSLTSLRSGQKPSSNSGNNNNKRQETRTNSSSSQHPWIVTTLKGHTSDVQDMNFSSNGKYLASCAEDNVITNSSPGRRQNNIRNTNASLSSSSSNDLEAIENDIKSSSSNEDLSSTSSSLISSNASMPLANSTPLAKSSEKKSAKSGRSRRQRKNQQRSIVLSNNKNFSTIDMDDECKENRRPLPSTNEKSSKKSSLPSSSSSTKSTTANNKKKLTEKLSSSSTSSLSSTSSSPEQSPKPKKLSTPLGSTKTNNTSKRGGNKSKDEIITGSAFIDNSVKYEKISKPLLLPDPKDLTSHMSELKLAHYLKDYIILPHLLRVYGYPVESASWPGCIEIMKCPFENKPLYLYEAHVNGNNAFYKNSKTQIINRNDGLKSWEDNGLDGIHVSCDSGQGSDLSNSPSIIDSDNSETEETNSNIYYIDSDTSQVFCCKYKGSLEKECVRCKRSFYITNTGEYLTTEECVYHWGKVNQVYLSNKKSLTHQYSCCNRSQLSEGCTKNRLHVWNGISFGINGPYKDYVKTKKRHYHRRNAVNNTIEGNSNSNNLNINNLQLINNETEIDKYYDARYIYNYEYCGGNYFYSNEGGNNTNDYDNGDCGDDDDYDDSNGNNEISNLSKTNSSGNNNKSNKRGKIYALDCEMCYTGLGLELAKITVIGSDGQLVYETYVKPKCEVVDYNTRFSGITESDLSSTNQDCKTFKQVQKDLLKLISSDTILIGHALDNDLRVLKLLHKNIIDTSITFPHSNGFPYKNGLKKLTKLYLKRDIQTLETGHNSFEDSRACLDLVLWKFYHDNGIEL